MSNPAALAPRIPPMETNAEFQDTLFASRTLREHWVRGVLGTVLAVAGFGLLPVVGPVSLLLLLGAGLSWRGCISCWALGLTQTKARLAAEGRDCASCAPADPETEREHTNAA